jgi:GT2 family glycosyltransferase
VATDPTCAILVLNWNGRPHLAGLLPSLQAARAAFGRPVALVVVDNRSSSDDVAWTRATFPDVEVVVTPRNDYLFSLNAVVAARPEEVVVILNNDMRVDAGFLAPLVAYFTDPATFAVAAAVYEWDGSAPQTGVRRIRFERGWLTHWFEKEPDGSAYTAEAGGGCSAYRRERFVALGGFDRLFRPGYWEDFDLTYRAWRQGWASVFEPRSVIYHRGGATLGRTLDDPALRRLLVRNQTLCLLKAVGGWRFAAQVLLRLPYRVCYHALRGEPAVAAGMLAAVPRLPRALLARTRLGAARLSSTDILRRLETPVTRRAPGVAA